MRHLMNGISLRALAVAYVPVMAFLAFLSFVSAYNNIPIGALTRDPATVGHFHPFLGVLSNVGILLWCSSAAICLFTGIVLRRTSQTAASRFLICSALLTLGLLADDLFLFHDYLAEVYLDLDQKLVYVILVSVTAGHLLTFRGVILQSEYAFLCLALMFFAISVGIDVLFSRQPGPWFFLIEDGAKLFALASWCTYYARVSYQFLVATPGVSPLPRPEPARSRASGL